MLLLLCCVCFDYAAVFRYNMPRRYDLPAFVWPVPECLDMICLYQNRFTYFWLVLGSSYLGWFEIV